MAQGYTDNYASTLSSGYTSGAASLVLTSVTGLPVSGLIFYVSVAAEGANTTELFKCTSYTGTTLTVVGAQGNTVASNHANGATITGCWILSAVLDGIRADQNQVGLYSALPASGMKQGDTFRCTDCNYNFIFDGSVWQAFLGESPALTIPPSASWSWDNQGSATIDGTYGTQYLIGPKTGATSIHVRYRTAPATPYHIIARMRHDMTGIQPGVSGTGVNSGYGLVFRDAGGKIVDCRIFSDNSGPGLVVGKWSSSTSFSAGYQTYQGTSSALLDFVFRQVHWLRIGDDGTNLTFDWSLDGMHWEQFFTSLRGNFLSTGPATVGFFVYCNGAAVQISVDSWTVTG